MMLNSLYTIKKEPDDFVFIEIISGEFVGIKYFLSDPEETENGLKYSYNIVSGEIPLEAGDRFIDLTKTILDDIIENFEEITNQL